MTFASATNFFYVADVAQFVGSSSDEILGRIAANSSFAVDTTQRDAWVDQIEVLKPSLAGLKGRIFLEFIVPRIGSRIDAVLISGPAIFVIEFKIGEKEFRRGDVNQVWDYALDLKNFHKASHTASIIPILVATDALGSDTSLSESHADGVFPPVRCNAGGLRHLVQ